MRAGEGVYRLGGEEFAVMLADVSRSVAEECGERIRRAVDNALFEEIPDALERQHKTISLGVAIYLTGESISDWFERADNALYAAKNTGRNKLCVSA